MPTPSFRYHAYLSHARGDDREPGRRWASWLHQALETYAVPPAIAGRRSPAGPVPSSLSPVYLETRAFPEDAPLDPTSKEALEQSRTLIVIASPDAAASRRVAEEIRYFKQLGRERIFALIIAGDPESEESLEQCYPDTLRHDVRRDGSLDREWRVHPVSADVRLEGNEEGCTTAGAVREQLIAGGLPASKAQPRTTAYAEKLEAARMKLIAGVLGVPLPELLRSSSAAESRAAAAGGARRSPVLVVLTLLLAVGAGAAGWWAWRANEQKLDAEDAKKRSDKLIAWMQRDLSDKLRGTDQFLALSDLNERVAQHFGLAATRGDDPEALALLADIMADNADMAAARGILPAAVELAKQALQLRERTGGGSRAPAGTDFRLVADHRRLAQALFKAGRKADALKEAETARNLALDLVQTRTSDSAALRQLAWTAFECGDMLAAIPGRHDDAKRALDEGVNAAKRLAAADPANIQFQRDVAQGIVRVGRLSQQRGDFTAALASYRDAQKITAPLASTHADDKALQGELAAMHNYAGSTLQLTSKYADAVTDHHQAVEIYERLAQQEPAKPEWNLELASSMRRLSENLLLAGPENKTEAITTIQRALDLLARFFPEKTDARASTLRSDLERLRDSAMK